MDEMMSKLDLSQWEEFAQKGFAVDKACMPIFEKALTDMGLVTIGELREYPPAGPGNQPGRFDLRQRPVGYYQRGAGWWQPVRKRGIVVKTNRRAGIIQGQAGQGVTYYKLRRTSEQLSKRWTQEVKSYEQAGFVEAVIGNTASYEQWVQGAKQTNVMAAIGWETADAAVEKLAPEYDEILSQMVDEVVSYFNRS
jgi:hypothetical protein